MLGVTSGDVGMIGFQERDGFQPYRLSGLSGIDQDVDDVHDVGLSMRLYMAGDAQVRSVRPVFTIPTRFSPARRSA